MQPLFRHLNEFSSQVLFGAGGKHQDLELNLLLIRIFSPLGSRHINQTRLPEHYKHIIKTLKIKGLWWNISLTNPGLSTYQIGNNNEFPTWLLEQHLKRTFIDSTLTCRRHFKQINGNIYHSRPPRAHRFHQGSLSPHHITSVSERRRTTLDNWITLERRSPSLGKIMLVMHH